MAPTSKQMTLMSKARAQATFDSKELTYVIFGDKETVKKRKAALHQVEKNSVKGNCDLMEERTFHEHNVSAAAVQTSSFRGQHGMFNLIIRLQGTLDQQQCWLPLLESREIIGTSVQSELGHEDFVRGLETTATFDTKADEFVINSPTITSTKCWPGGLSLKVSHAVVSARLTINSSDYGIHSFILPVRSLETYELLPGIELSNIGHEAGLSPPESGYAVFKDVHIPRTNMLMGLAQVQRDGTYAKDKSSSSQPSDDSLIHLRSQITRQTAFHLAKAVTIATRYSAVRTQGHGFYHESPHETPLISSKPQHARLLTLNAQALALLFASKACTKLLLKSDQAKYLPYIHALTSGLKAHATRLAASGTKAAQECCGSLGHSVSSGLPAIVAHASFQCTQGGNNDLLYHHTARALLTAISQIKRGGTTPFPLHPSLAYLTTTTNNNTTAAPPPITPQTLLRIFHSRATTLLTTAHTLMTASTARSPELLGRRRAWDEHALLLAEAAKAHVEVFVLESFLAVVARIGDQRVDGVVGKLWVVYAVDVVSSLPPSSFSSFPSSTTSSSSRAAGIEEEEQEGMHTLLNTLLEQLLPDAIGLIDAWDFTDGELDSALGAWDGDVYGRIAAAMGIGGVGKDDLVNAEEGRGVVGQGEGMMMKAKL